MILLSADVFEFEEGDDSQALSRCKWCCFIIELSLLLRTPGIGIVFLKPSLSIHCVMVKFLPWTRPLQYIRYGFLPSTEKSCEDYAPGLVTCSMISRKISPRRDL